MVKPFSQRIKTGTSLAILKLMLLVCQSIAAGSGYADSKARSFLILSGTDSIPVSFVHVINYTTGKVVTSNYEGKAIIDAKAGDTLLFSCIGYYFSKDVLSHQSPLNDTIFLIPRIQDLDPVVIIPYKTYEDFKTAFIKLKLPETRLDVLKRNLRTEASLAGKNAFDEGCENYIKNPDGTFGGGATIGLNFPTREDIQRKKLALVAPVEKEQQYVDQKFNYAIVKEITGLEEPELSDFILYCDFTHEFLFYSSEYSIFMAIKTNLNEYIKKRRAYNPSP